MDQAIVKNTIMSATPRWFRRADGSVNEQEYAMVGEKTKKKYQLGDKVRIKVLKCDKIKKTIDFSLIDGNIEGVEKSGEATRDETDSQ